MTPPVLFPREFRRPSEQALGSRPVCWSRWPISTACWAVAIALATSAAQAFAEGIGTTRSNPGPISEFRVPNPGVTAIVVRTLPQLSMAELSRAKSAASGLRAQVGVTRSFAELNTAPIKSRELTWIPVQHGRAARFRIESKGAKGLRIAFSSLHATGAQARYRDTAAPWQSVGPVPLVSTVGENDTHWSPVTFGDAVDVEIFVPGDARVDDMTFFITEVAHLFSGLAESMPKSTGDAAACERDVACFSLNATATAEVTTTALVLVTNASGTFACSGTAMNSDPFSGIPYFLTASGCVADAAEAANVNTLWNYEATTCGSNVARSFSRLTGGADLLARDDSKNLAFLRLRDALPSSVTFSGWGPNPVTAGTSIQAAHHPQADLKKFNIGAVQIAGSPLRVGFTTGVTEPGSTGAGIFADDQYLIGVLAASRSSCANPSGLDDFAPFATMWPSVMHFLRPSTRDPNYSDLWWTPAESGWGLAIADHETQLFAVWYTYREDSSPTWLVLPGGSFSQGKRFFSGDLYETRGPPYTETFDPARVTVSKVGAATIDFSPPGLAAGSALFSYTVGAVSGTKQIQRQPFGNAAPVWGDDLTDIYWDPSEPGWGMTIAQHGDNLFAVWYTYDASGRPLFVVMPGASFGADGSITGDVYTTTGPYLGAIPFDPAKVQVTKLGSATFVFDPVSAASKALSVSPACKYNFLACKRGHFIPCAGGNCYGKWISPQPYGHQSPDIPPPACDIEYYDWSPCVDGSQSAAERMRSPAGCSGPSVLTRACEVSAIPQPCNFMYGTPYGTCINGVRTHTLLTSTPANCVGTPTSTEPCVSNACTSITVGDWSECQPNNTQTRQVTGTPAGCVPGLPTVQSCTYAPPTATCLGSYDINITLPYCGNAIPATGALTITGASFSMPGSFAGNLSSRLHKYGHV